MDANFPRLIYSSNIPDYNDKEDQRKREQFREALGHKGWLYPTFTPQYGGGGLSTEQAVIISKDEDFVDRWLLSDKPVTVLWIRKGNCSNRTLMAWLQPLWPQVMKRLDEGEQLIELRE